MLELVLNLAVKQYALTILPLTTAKPSVRDFLLFSKEASTKMSFLQFLEQLLPLVGTLFTMQGVRHLYSSFSSYSLAFLLVTDNPKINYPFPFFLLYAYHWGRKFMTSFPHMLHAGASSVLQIPYM